MTEETPLPLSRMAVINKPSFWIFLGACLLLSIYNKAVTQNSGDILSHSFHNDYIIIVAFVGLFLTLLNTAIKNITANRIFSIGCYVYEIASVVWLGVLIF